MLDEHEDKLNKIEAKEMERMAEEKGLSPSEAKKLASTTKQQAAASLANGTTGVIKELLSNG
jgi:hypothetical protein